MAKSKKYAHKKIEEKWQARWGKEKLFTPNVGKAKHPYYNLWMFPYPSAEGLHAGHAFSSTGSDVMGRFMRMCGRQVFQPIGYDSFGIHSENFAIKTGKHPRKLIDKTTKTYEKQLKSLGHAYDWTRTVTTSDVDYYKWTQWLFLQMFKSGLAYRKKTPVNWCPSCKTVLADEQVIDEKCERCGTVVEKKNLEQWFFRITDYADRLLQGLEKIDWPEKIKIAQKNWIGKKEGLTISYKVVGRKLTLECWTSRPDTNFGATFIVVSPENPLALSLTKRENYQKVSKYIKESQRSKVKGQRSEAKTGVFTGSYAINDLTGEKMPIWVSDFVLMEVGTGAVVGVPGHDRRDFEFAKKFKLSIKRVVVGPDGDKSKITKLEQVQEEEGTMINSDFLDKMDTGKARSKIMKYLEEKGWGRRETTYHLRDWTISRQRYWGPPIPMIYCQKCAGEGKSWFASKEAKNFPKIGNWKLGFGDSADWSAAGWWPVAQEDLPVELPEIKDYLPKGEGKGPLADHPEFYEVKCPECASMATRETDVSDTFLDSSWYFLRYPSVGIKNSKTPKLQNSKKMENLPWDQKVTRCWLPVDLYFGGAEHAVLHLMYARFVTMVLNDLKHVDFSEPFPRFFAHGLMIKHGAKMSKSRGNVVSPDTYIEKYGADTFRLYVMFLGPMDGYPDFRDTGIEGMRRFVEKVWNLFQISNFPALPAGRHFPISNEDRKKLITKTHQTIKNVTKDIQNFRYNTAIASIMEFVNALRDVARVNADSRTDSRQGEWQEALRTLTLLLAPFAPHMTEELWQNNFSNLRKSARDRRKSVWRSIHTSAWPMFNPSLAREIQVTVPVQVDGKLRATLEMDRKDAKFKKKVAEMAKNEENVKKWLKGKRIKDTIFVSGKLINFVTA